MKKPIPFGKYVLLERVNVGGMAEVFKAKAFGVEGFERLVAVKRILPSIAEDQEFITMFIDEAKIAVQLTHANIAQIFDLGKVGDSYFIAMEFVHGRDLRAIFDRARKRGETVPIPMACYDVMKVCEGLDYAHNKKDASGRELNLVHRDVSPQNILISFDGETKIIDFGIAKAAGKAGKTQAGILKGKFGYMSPEQVRGLPLDRRSDVFAVGIVLYELLTGERLFVGESDFATLEKVRNVEIMPPSTYNRRIPEELEQIVIKALAKEVDDRYQTAMDLHDDLQSFMYTSGNFFSRKDLSAYMRKAFADEMAKETRRQEEFRRMEAQGGGAASGLEAFADLPSANPPAKKPKKRTQSGAPPLPKMKRARQRTIAGLGDPRATSAPPPPPRTSHPPALPGSSHKPPRPMPRASSAPPPELPSSGKSGSKTPAAAKAGPSRGPAAGAGAALDMDWDDEELSTQIYDKPEDGAVPKIPELSDSARALTASSSPGTLPAASPSSARPSHPAESASPAYPKKPSGKVPGAPSPFDDLPPADSKSTASKSAASVSGGPTAKTRRNAEPTKVTRREAPAEGGGSPALAVAAVALVALIIGGGAAWWFLLRSSPGTIHVATDPPDAVVYLDNQPATSSTASPFVLANVAPGEHLVEVRRHGYATWATRVVLGSDQTLQLPSIDLVPVGGAGAGATPGATPGASAGTSPAVAGTGFRLDTVPPGATVFVDDEPITGVTPVTVDGLTPGTHRIRTELANHAPWTGEIDVTAGVVSQLPRAVLTLRQVSVRFESVPPGAEVTLRRGAERRTVGETPLTAPVNTSGDAWSVEMTLRGYEDYSAELSLPSGQTEYTMRAELERSESAPSGSRSGSRGRRGGGGSSSESGGGTSSGGTSGQASTGGGRAGSGGGAAAATGAPGTLRVNTTPWSEVFVDGRRIGNTPQMNISLPAGRHSITLVNPDFNIRESVSVNIQSGQTETLIRRLTPGG